MCENKRMIFALIPALLLIGTMAHPAQASVTLDRLEASVNSSIILRSDVEKFRQTAPLRAQLDPLFAGTALAAEGPNAPDADIVQFLIDERLIAQAFPVSDSEVEQEINSIQASNKIDRAALKSALREQGFKFEDYFELIRISVAKRNLIDRDIRTKVTISDDDVKNYFYNHYAKTNETPSAYRVSIISILRSSYKSASAAHDVAVRALQAIRSGESFEEVARRFSDDPSRESGGDLGTLSGDQMAPAIRNQVKKLKIGEVSEVFGDPQTGYFILKLVDVRSGESDRLAKVKEDIRNQLAAQEYQHQMALWLARERQSAFIHKAGESSVAGLNPLQP
jgi:peptidyl-prolyl cis-trans isomerase SurA